MPFEPGEAQSVRILYWKPDTSFPTEDLTKLVYRGLNLSKQARVAIIADYDHLGKIPQHLAKYLDPKRNYHWSGANRRLELERRIPRVLVGEYSTWFCWYMRFQRFKAFQTVILVDPLAAVSDKDAGGFIDGLLVRLMTRVPRIVVVTRGTTERALPQSDESHIGGTLMSLLYGTRLSHLQLTEVVRLTFVPISDQALRKTLSSPHWQNRLHNSRYELSDDDEELVQGMVPSWKSYGPGDSSEGIEQLFQRAQKREYVRPEAKWVEDQILTLSRIKGWFATQDIRDYFQKRFGEFASSTVPPPKEAYPYIQREYRTEAQVFLPSPSIVRRVCDSLVARGRLTTHMWYREIGRPALVYTEPERLLPFKEDARCGQCAFYKPSKNQCRIWWLADKKHRFYDQWWKRPGSGVSEFDVYKMKYSHRIGPHSSACSLFLDKKRDHTRKAVPFECEICDILLPETDRKKPSVCPNCGTKYVPRWGKVKVQTSYEHEFRRCYKEVTGSEAEADLLDWKAKLARSPLREIERTLELDFEPDSMAVIEQPEPAAWVRPNFSPSLQRLVDEKVQTTDFAKFLSMAMMQSAINATRRIAIIGHPNPVALEESIGHQERYLSLASEVGLGKLLTYEAHAMREYWLCYDSALEPALQWFGPRKKYRFVMEFVDDPGGRAKGYSALHAAINYLHQRRLREATRINSEAGFEGTSDGFLHHRRYNSRHFGLLFDMIDPFKFADREGLLAVVLNRGITWRDFRMESDRQMSTFYYPGSSARTTLEQVGADADQSVVRYQGVDSSLRDAYRRFATSLLNTLGTGDGTVKFEPFVYAPV